MKLKKWLKQMDLIGPHVIIWTQKQLDFDEKEPLYNGSIMDIPWYLAEYKLCNNKELLNFEAPITYVDSFKKEYNIDRPGFIIIVEEPE